VLKLWLRPIFWTPQLFYFSTWAKKDPKFGLSSTRGIEWRVIHPDLIPENPILALFDDDDSSLGLQHKKKTWSLIIFLYFTSQN
jgi:hypothetical protein